MYSIIVPIYKNEDSIVELINVLDSLNKELDQRLETVFVIDGSPDKSFSCLEEKLPHCSFSSSVLVLSRNFGAFSAVRAGLTEAKGPFFAVMAADLQEPPELIKDFFATLEKEPYDVVIGARKGRADPLLSRFFTKIFWGVYRRFIMKEIPQGGVDVFGCNTEFRNWLVNLKENNTSLIGLLFWLGFRRKEVSYTRLARKHGKSAWLFSRKLRYLSDSVFSFSDLPIRLLIAIGMSGMIFSVLFAAIIIIARISGDIQVPGYATNILFLLFIFAFNAFGLGIIGSYVWRTFENTKQRPSAIVMLKRTFEKGLRV